MKGLAKEIHTVDNHKWWHTPEGVRLERNKGELIALMHSELSEMWEAILHGKMDDKLPHLPGKQVELADFVVRALDYSGAYDLDIALIVLDRSEMIDVLNMHLETSRLLEAVRKGQPEAPHMSRMLSFAFRYAELSEFDLLDVIAQKRAYNAVRKDHTHEERYAKGGKKF